MARIREWPLRLWSAFCLNVALASCGAEFNSIQRTVPVPSDRSTVLLVDAKQRAIIAAPARNITTPEAATDAQNKAAGKPSRPQSQPLFCSEPSPDVFAVYAASFSGTGSFGQSGASAANVNAALSAAGASSEQGSTIPRTQTVNLLKEAMFRTCERYLNGAIGPLEFSVQAIRDQRLIVATLAIEQLTGAVLPKAVILGASGGAAAGSSAGEAVVRIDDAFKAKASADLNVTTTKSAYDELNGTSKDCEIVAKDPKSDAAVKTGKTETCPKALAAKTQAADAATKAGERLATLQQAMASGGGGPASASATVGPSNGAGGLDQAQATNIATVALAVKEIVQANYAEDQFELICVKILDPAEKADKAAYDDPPKDAAGNPIVNDNGKPLPSVRQQCLGYFSAKLERDIAMKKNQAIAYERESDEIIKSMEDIRNNKLSNFDKFWNLSVENRRKAADSILSKAPVIKSARTCLTTTLDLNDRSKFEQCYAKLPPDIEKRISAII